MQDSSTGGDDLLGDIGTVVASKEARPEEMEGDGLTIQEIQALIDESIGAIYERAYNLALDDILEVVDDGLDAEEFRQKIEGMRKTCFTSSSQKQ